MGVSHIDGLGHTAFPGSLEILMGTDEESSLHKLVSGSESTKSSGQGDFSVYIYMYSIPQRETLYNIIIIMPLDTTP